MQINAASRGILRGRRPTKASSSDDAIIREHAPALPRGERGMGGTPMLGYGEQPYQTKAMKEPGSGPLSPSLRRSGI